VIGRKAIAIIVALGVGVLAGLGGIYLYQQGALLPLGSGQDMAATGDNPPQAAAPSEPRAAAPAEAAPQVQAETSGAVRPNADPTAVPSFDVVLIQPSGEGVIAGRAAPGWEVTVQSKGTKVATATADAQGEWSAVLDKPLAPGDHALSLKITSPDGTRALSSQEWVNVEVGKAGASPAPALPQADPPAATASVPGAPTAAPSEALALTEPQGGARAVTAATEAATPASPASKPTIVFRTVDYADTESAIGSVSITGASDPGATISVYCDNEPLATVRAGRDGAWRVVVEMKLGTGQHNFRAERIDAATGKASAQALVAIERLVPKPAEVAAKEATPNSQGAAAGSRPSSVAALDSGQSAQDHKEVYVIRRGDTLWAIAKRYLGSGLRYTTIFQDNRQTINNPNLIHPQQEVTVPPR